MNKIRKDITTSKEQAGENRLIGPVLVLSIKAPSKLEFSLTSLNLQEDRTGCLHNLPFQTMALVEG